MALKSVCEKNDRRTQLLTYDFDFEKYYLDFKLNSASYSLR